MAEVRGAWLGSVEVWRALKTGVEFVGRVRWGGEID